MDDKKVFDPIMYIVVRGDLEMPPGKLAAQAGHAAVEAYISAGSYLDRYEQRDVWRDNGGAKICVRVKDAAELHDIHHAMIDLGIPAEIIEDAGHTVFDKPTVTCMGVGPLWRREAGRLAKLPLY